MLEKNSVSENRYITEVRRALLREGFWGRPVQKLIEELRDHFLAETKAFEAQGHSQPEARERAAAALGEPRIVAAEWRRTLQTKSWIATHPFLTVGIGMLGIVVYYSLSLLAFLNLSGWRDAGASNHQLKFLPLDGWLGLMNWLPWGVGIVLLTWRAIRFPSGWKTLLVGCVALGLVTSAFQVAITLPHDGDLRGSVSVDGTTWTSLWMYPAAYCLNGLQQAGFYRQGIWMQLWLCPGLFKLLLPPLACWLARFSMGGSGNFVTSEACSDGL